MTSPQPSLAEMDARMNQWMNEKPQGNFNNTTELRLNQNDIVIFQFAASGSDGDRLIKPYRSHIFGLVSKNNKRYNEARYCPIQNGDGQACMWCEALANGSLPQGTGEIKERMSMWLLVHQILHASLPPVVQGQPAPQWPIVNYQGQNYYMEEVNAWKIWHTSAWRESPWSDINRTAAMYGGSLHAFTAQILCSGAGMNKRFKFNVLPNSAALPREYYEQAWTSLTPIPDLLHEETNRNLSQNPQPTAATFSAAQPIANNFIPGGVGSPASVPAFQPVAAPAVFTPPAAPAPAFAAPAATVAPPLAVAPPPAPATFQPGAQPAVAGVPGGYVEAPRAGEPPPIAAQEPAPQAPPAPVQAPQTVAPPVAPPVAVAPPAPPAAPAVAPPAPALPVSPQPTAPVATASPEDAHRPMRRMF